MAALTLAGQNEERNALRELKKEIESLEQGLRQLRSRASSERDQLSLLEAEIDIQSRQLEAARRTVTEIEIEQTRGEQRLEDLSRRRESQKLALEHRMVALYKMGELSYLRLLLSGDLDPDSLGMLNYLVKRDARVIEEFRATNRALEEQRNELASKRADADEVARIMVSKKDELERSRADQRRLITQLAARERSQQERLEELEEKAKRLQRLLVVLSGEAGAASGGIGQFRGALGWPVEGEVVEAFGRQRSRKFETFTVNNGIRIRTEPGNSVRPVFAGTVIYAQWFKGYGNLVIVDHGDRIFTLYGNLRSNMVERGVKVSPSDVIGTAELDGAGPAGALYFEVRVDNEPVDPMRWLR